MDKFTPAVRSAIMRAGSGRDTRPERTVGSRLHRLGYRFRKHRRITPGSPDIEFPSERVAVFIDGDFWHGFRFAAWRGTLPDYWKRKIERNVKRDRRNFARLRRLGWCVIRVWEHDVLRSRHSDG